MGSFRERFYDDFTSVDFVVGLDFLGGERTGAGDRAVEIVGVCGAQGRNVAAGLCPGGGVEAMGVDDAADFRKGAIEFEMGGGVAAGVERAFDDFSGFQRDDGHVFGVQLIVGDAGGFDDDEVG